MKLDYQCNLPQVQMVQFDRIMMFLRGYVCIYTVLVHFKSISHNSSSSTAGAVTCELITS
jgi:hypothetical protein